MKATALDKIDTNLEQIITKLTAVGHQLPDALVGSLSPLEFDSLKLAQETLGLLRRERRTTKK